MVYLIIFVVLFVVELVYIRVAAPANLVDKPNGRSSHHGDVVIAGGIVFFLGCLINFVVSGFNYPVFFTGLFLISLISFIDDIRPQSSSLRLIIHFISIGLLLYEIGIFGFNGFIILFSLILCTGIINAYNFMDGINGMTAGYSLVILSSLLYINTCQFTFIDNSLLITTLVSVLVFTFFNFRTKARCFAGDVGSISISFIIVFLLGSLIYKTHDFSYLLFLVLYGVDAIFTIIHRLILRENILKPHRKHMYQLMANELGIPQVLVSGIYMLIQALISLGLIMTSHHYAFAVVMIVLFSVIYIVFMRRFYRLHTQRDSAHVE